MSSANKTLKTSDVTVAPYLASRGITIPSSSLTANGVGVYSGINIPLTTTGSYPQSGIYYRSARHLYYSNNLANLNSPLPLSQQNYDQLVEDEKVGMTVNTTLIYNNSLQSTAASGSSELDYRKDFPTGSNVDIKIVSVPTALYGEAIVPQSFSIKETGSYYNIVDDGNGNLIETAVIRVGDQLEGGTVAYIYTPLDPEFVPGKVSGLIMGPVLDYAAPWGCIGTYIFFTAPYTGLHATQEIIAQCITPGIAAKLCYDYSNDGYTDWYLPTNVELVNILNNQPQSLNGVELWSSDQDDATYAFFCFSAFGVTNTSIDTKSYTAGAMPVRQFSIDPPSTTAHAGNIIYGQGLAIITSPYLQNFNSYTYDISFNSNLTIYQSQIRCHVNENEFNLTLNPSALSGSYGDLNSNITGSYFQPYVTSIGLYNAANELLAVGKLGQPFPMPANTDVTFVVRWDS